MKTHCYIHMYTIVLQFYNLFLYTPNKYLTCDNQTVSTMETQIFMQSWLFTNMINTDSRYRPKYAYNNNGIDVLSHYSHAFSPTAHITHIRVCATLSALMCHQATLTSECLITHITGIWTLTTCICLFFIRLYCWINAILHTLQKYGSSPPTVCWCVTSLFWCLNTLLHTL